MLLSKMLRKIIDRRTCCIKMKHIWTAERTVQSPYDDIVVPELTLNEYMWRDLHKWSDKTALVCAVTDRKYTYYQAYKQSQAFGASLRKKFKIKEGDIVLVMLSNLPEYPIVVLGILYAGGLASTVNPLYTVYEIQKQLTSSEPKLIVVEPENVVLIKEVLNLSKLSIPIITVDVNTSRPENTVSYAELVNDSHLDKDILKEVKINTDDTAFLLYSSGTTGIPKAVEITHKGIITNFEQQNEEACKKFENTTETNQDVVLCYLPMFHIYGLAIVTLHSLSVGLKVVTLPKFLPETFVGALEKHKFTLMLMVPPTVLFLASNPKVTSKHFEKLRYALVGAAPIPVADIERFLSKINHKIHFSQGYGLSEGGPLVTLQSNKSNDYTSVGYALPSSQLRIVDEQMNNLGPNEVGELLIKGPHVMKGYRNNPEANAQVFVDGWLRSGDLAKIDERGCVTIIDRLKELIKVSGYQVPPAELENVIKEHPAVFDAAVLGIPDVTTGQKPKAFVMLNKDFRVTEEDIMEYVSKRVAPYKRLKEISFVDNIPKSPTGKILKRIINEQYCKK